MIFSGYLVFVMLFAPANTEDSTFVSFLAEDQETARKSFIVFDTGLKDSRIYTSLSFCYKIVPRHIQPAVSFGSIVVDMDFFAGYWSVLWDWKEDKAKWQLFKLSGNQTGLWQSFCISMERTLIIRLVVQGSPQLF